MNERKLVTVGELIDTLKQFDLSLPVILYDAFEEDSVVVDKVELETEDYHHYTKGDHALFYNRELSKTKAAVTIIGRGFC